MVKYPYYSITNKWVTFMKNLLNLSDENQNNEKPQGEQNNKLWKIGLLIVAAICIVMLFVFQEQRAVKWTFILIGTVCTFTLGIFSGIELKRSGKWRTMRQLKFAIGLPVFVYWVIVYLILENYVGWL